MTQGLRAFVLIVGLAACPSLVAAQLKTEEDPAGSAKYVPPQPAKADTGIVPVPVSKQPRIARLNLDPQSGDAVNEAINDDNQPIVLQYAKYGANAGRLHQNSIQAMSLRGLIAPGANSAERGDANSLNRRALSLIRNSESMRHSGRTYRTQLVQAARSSSRNAGRRSHGSPASSLASAGGKVQSSITSPVPAPVVVPTVEPANTLSAAQTPEENNALVPALNAELNAPALPNKSGATPAVATSQKPAGPASLHIAREAAKPVVAPIAAAPAIDTWEKYFLDVSAHYQFTDQQHSAGKVILEHLRSRAGQYRLSREKDFAKAANLTDKAERDRRTAELNAPIDRMFNELKIRLENLPTLQQKHQAVGPAPKA